MAGKAGFLAWYASCTYPVSMRLWIALPMLLVACGGSVKVLERTPRAGAIAVSGSEEACRARAHRYMSDHCTQGYTLVDERPTSDGWKMSYRCNERAAPSDTEARLETVTIRD